MGNKMPKRVNLSPGLGGGLMMRKARNKAALDSDKEELTFEGMCGFLTPGVLCILGWAFQEAREFTRSQRTS